MTQHHISIGMPVYNGSRYLEGAIASILEQTHEDFELLIADNASEDDSLAIAAAFAQRDDRVRLLPSDTNHGAAWNYNRLVPEAKGSFFKWAAHDDLLHPLFLQRCIAALLENPEASLAYSHTVLIDEAGTCQGRYPDPLNVSDDDGIARALSFIRETPMANPIFGLLRTDILRRTPLIEPFDSSDMSLLVELALHGPFVRVDEDLFLRRVHPDASRHANTTSAEVQAWFSPTGEKGRMLPMQKAYQRSVVRWAPSRAQRVRGQLLLGAGGLTKAARVTRRDRRRRKRLESAMTTTSS